MAFDTLFDTLAVENATPSRTRTGPARSQVMDERRIAADLQSHAQFGPGWSVSAQATATGSVSAGR